MTPKEKAEELVNNYTKMFANGKFIPAKNTIKQCALIAVDVTIDTLNMDIRDLDVRGSILIDLIIYWRQVREEIINQVPDVGNMVEDDVPMYTKEDMKKCWNEAFIQGMSIDEKDYKPLFFQDLIQSLKQPKK